MASSRLTPRIDSVGIHELRIQMLSLSVRCVVAMTESHEVELWGSPQGTASKMFREDADGGFYVLDGDVEALRNSLCAVSQSRCVALSEDPITSRKTKRIIKLPAERGAMTSHSSDLTE